MPAPALPTTPQQPLRIAFAGTPEFAVPPLEALAGSGHRVVGVLTQPDRPKGRGRALAASAVKSAAERLGLPLAQPVALKAHEDRAVLMAWQPDLIVVAAYGLILPASVLELPRLGCLNIHASLLPRWRGAAPIQRAILAGDDETGITIMQMERGLDTGPMLLRHPEPIGGEDTSGSLHERLARAGAACLLQAIDSLMRGDLRATPQPASGITYAAKIEKAEALIDWSAPSAAVHRRIRAFHPWPVAETRWAGEQLRIQRAALGPPGVTATAGQVVAITPEGVLVSCGSGSILLLEVQRPGRRPVAAAELARSVQLVGTHLG